MTRTGLRGTETEARARAFLADRPDADQAAAKKLLDKRYALTREVFEEARSAVNVAHMS